MQSDWQPIETAPKDGTYIVICNARVPGEYSVGKYDPMMWDSFEPIEGTDTFRKVRQMITEWRGLDNFHRATHWMPLPTPPNEQTDAE